MSCLIRRDAAVPSRGTLLPGGFRQARNGQGKMTGMSDPSPAVRALHQVAVHVVARARQQATGRFSLRVTSGGFGTPELRPDSWRVRVSNGTLLVEADA